MMKTTAARWDGSLESLFAVLDEACRTRVLPRRLERPPSFTGRGRQAGAARPLQPELFAASEAQAAGRSPARAEGAGGPPAPECLPPVSPDPRRSPSAALLRELSPNAFDAVVHAWMSEFPIAAEIIRFAWGVIAAAREEAARAGPPETEPLRRPCPPAEPAGTPGIGAFWPGADAAQSPRWAALPEARRGAERAASDRGSPDTRAVLEAAYKTGREIDRLMGLLRFTPCFPGGTGSSGGGPVYVARCSPDHHVLPGLAEHFTQRFGECPWAVIDEKRRLVLAGKGGGPARLFPLSPEPAGAIAPGGPADAASPSASGTAPDYGNLPDYNSPSDYYEALWRNYHHSINNPARNNPALQRQFMPRRYWKYLTELQ